jgi:uncharacterized membrane protein (DUF485 family)
VTLVEDTPGRPTGRPVGPSEQSLFGRMPEPRRRRGPNFAAIQREPEFTVLRSRQRWFIFPVSLLFMAWYMTFVLLAAYAHSFMSRPVLGLINVGMVLGLLQFVSTLLIMLAYCRYAKRSIDPATEQVRQMAEELT